MCEILGDVNHVSAADDRESGHIVIGIEQVFAVMRRIHEAPVDLCCARSETDVFSLRAELQATGGREALWQRGLTGQVMRKPLLRSHERRVLPCSPGQSFIALQRRYTGLSPRMIRKVKKLALSLRIVWS